MQNETNDNDRLLTRAEVEVRFGLTRRYLENAAVKGGGPVMVRLGRGVRYRVGDVRDWIEARRVRSTSEQVQS